MPWLVEVASGNQQREGEKEGNNEKEGFEKCVAKKEIIVVEIKKLVSFGELKEGIFCNKKKNVIKKEREYFLTFSFRREFIYTLYTSFDKLGL